MLQLFQGLRYLHSSNIVHRDLKPRNLLVNSNCKLKIADFGLARVSSPSNESTTVPMTDYITTRWYRAPEVIVGWSNYTSAIDIWASGTILAELLGREPLFPGIDSINQLELIVKKLGQPSEAFMSKVRKSSYRKRLREFPYRKFDIMYRDANPNCTSLLQMLLQIDPDLR